MEREDKDSSARRNMESLTGELLTCYEELDFIYESGDLLTSYMKRQGGEWKDVAGAILANAIEVFEADLGWVSLADEEEKLFRVEETAGIEHERAKLFSALFNPGERNGTVLLKGSIRESITNWEEGDPETILFAPLKWGGNCFGSLVIGRKGDRLFDSHHIKLIRHLSGYFANVFENAKMFQKINQAYLLTKDANERLKKLAEMKEKFITLTSHELKTPLSIIAMCTEMMTSEVAGDLTGHQREIADAIDNGVGRLQKIVMNLVKMTGVEGERFCPERKRFNVSELILEVSKEMAVILKKRGINFHVDISPNIEMTGDRKMIKELFTELTLNAVKNTPDGGSIEAVGERNDDSVLVEVKDSGSGVPEEDKEAIFDKFYTSGDYMNHSSGSYQFKSGGIGVGLALAKAIIEAHGGKIWVKSPAEAAETGKGAGGSSFFFSIPDCKTDKARIPDGTEKMQRELVQGLS